MNSVNTAIPYRYASSVLEEWLPNDARSKEDYDVEPVDVRIQDRQPSRNNHLDDNPRFYEGFRPIVLEWVSCGSITAIRYRDPSNNGTDTPGRTRS